MEFKIIFKKMLLFALTSAVLLSAAPTYSAYPGATCEKYADTQEPTKHHRTEHYAKFFPMTKRKFFIDKSMVYQISKSSGEPANISDFDEPVGMAILEAIQILDMGDPYKMSFETRRDFDVLYEKYIDFSQILVALQIPEIILTKKIPYMTAKIARKRIPPRATNFYMLRYTDPYQIIRANYWLKVPIRITLKSEPGLTPRERIGWNLALRFAVQLASKRLPDAVAYEQMHNLWAILPSLFPEV